VSGLTVSSQPATATTHNRLRAVVTHNKKKQDHHVPLALKKILYLVRGVKSNNAQLR